MLNSGFLNKVTTFLLLVIIFLLVFPNTTFAAKPTISISTEKDEYKVGDQIAVVYEINTADKSINSVELSFSFDKDKLTFQDDDIATPGLQISKSSSAFSTVTKNVADNTIGQLDFNATSVTPVTGEKILFQAVFKVEKPGVVLFDVISDFTKVYEGVIKADFDFSSKEITILEDGAQSETSQNIEFSMIHTPHKTTNANENASFSLNVIPADKVSEARLYYKNETTESFVPVKLVKSGEDSFDGQIPAAEVTVGTIQYFFGIIDTNNAPHRYPEANEQFFDIAAEYKSTGEDLTLSDIPVENNPVVEQSVTYNNTTKTGPEDYVFLLIMSLFLPSLVFNKIKNN